MNRPPKKDYYLVLGIEPDATFDEIKSAYISRTRIIHPDRFDPKTQPAEWRLANDMLAEMSEAYSVLRNSQTRSEYDRWRSASKPPTTTQQSQDQPSPDQSPANQSSTASNSSPDELTAGKVSFGDLPKNSQERLQKRQLNQNEDQFQVKLQSVGQNYVYIVGLLGWFWFLFANARNTGPRWDNETLSWYAIISIAVGVLAGYNLVKVIRWRNSTLKPFFYVTPLYFIRTEFDEISFRPIWTLKDTDTTHHYRNNAYEYSTVILSFADRDERLVINSKKQVDEIFSKLQIYRERLRSQYQQGHYDYFLLYDDFINVTRSEIPPKSVLHRNMANAVYLLCTLASCSILAAAAYYNQASWENRWGYQHIWPTSPTPYAESTPYAVSAPIPTPSQLPEQPLPKNGAVRSFTSQERIAPFQIETGYGGYYLVKLVNVSSNRPVMTVFVYGGATIKVRVPLGQYEIRYASGEKWYGYRSLFGPDTAYSKAEETFDFNVVGEEVSGYTITLYKVQNGNLRTTMIRPEDF